MPDRERQAELIEAAVAYAGRGFPVFPCKGKVPLTEHGFQDASTDPETVLTWWTRWPEANIGMPTGEASGVVVLDVDVQHGGAGTLAELERQHGKIPPTAEVLTPSGGRHYWFSHRPLKSTAGVLGDGLDTRGEGGYVVLPPSVGENERPYKFLSRRDRAALPDWVVEIVDGQKRRNGSAPPVEGVIPEGRRRQELLSLAGTLRRRGLSAEEILTTLETVNDKRCQPPLARGELEALANDVADRYEPAKNSFSPPIALEAGGNEFSFAPVPLENLLENVPPEPAWRLRGYLAPFALTLLAGRPKVGKSTAVFALMARLVAGEPFAGIETAPAGVLLLSEERRDTLAEKARILGLNSFPPLTSPKTAETNKPVHVLMRQDARGAAWPEVVRLAMTYCHQHGLEVLVVDTWDRWTNLRGDSENAAGAVNEALEPLQYAAASGLAVLIVTHQRKSLGEFGEAVRGSNALTGGVDVVVELERPAPSLSLSKHARALRAVSRFSSTPDELFLELDEEEGVFAAIDSPEEVKAAAERERVLGALGTFEEGATSKEIAAKVELPEPTVRRYLKTLLEGEHVLRTGEGKRNDPYRWSLASDRTE